MEAIKTLTLPQGFDIDILYKNGKIGYTFVFNGQNYGTAIKPQSKKVADIAAACLLLLINADEVYKELQKSENKPCPDCGEKSTVPGVNYLTCKSHGRK